jgi:superfamily II DNA or RNA helicase
MTYPFIEDEQFHNRINRIYKRFAIPKKRKTMRQICFPKKYKLQMPQKFVSKYINPSTPYKGILVFHRLGAGKTCTAIRVGEEWKNHRKIMVITPASLKGNFRKDLRSECAGSSYLTPSERNKLKKLHPASKEYKAIIKQSDARIDKHYEIYSYNKFVDLYDNGKINFKNKIVIIDEVQNMISENGTFYEAIYDAIHTSPKNLRIILLSATPMFDKPVEIALTMNLLRLTKPLPTGREFDRKFISCKMRRNGKVEYNAKNLDLFKESIKGRVSYFRGAPPYAFPEKMLKYVKCEMSPFQYKSYKAVLMSEDKGEEFKKMRKTIKKFGDLTKLPNNFFFGTRMISNIAFPNMKVGQSGYDSLKGACMNIKNLQRYSPKFYRIIRKIKRCSGTVFIYSNFKEFAGIKSFIKILEYYGFKNYSKHGEGRKRFAIWSGDEKLSKKEEIRSVFNMKENTNGSKIKILLGSPAIKEGVTLLRVQQVHIMEPYWNESRLEQVIGRAIRYCSHKDMPPDKRKVKVYIYIAVANNKESTIDQYIHHLADRKNKLVKQFELAMKEIAVDCTLNKYANSYRGEEPIKCDK